MGSKATTIKVYHGGTEVISSPRTAVGRSNLDFGPGFYLTDIYSQAEEWARRMGNLRQLSPVINIYMFNYQAVLDNYNCKIFSDYDEQWLDFIVQSRLGNKPWLSSDYIEGGVANDRVIDTINLYIADLITKDKVLERLSEHRPNNQLCILNQEIIDKHLVFYEAVRP